MNPEFRLALENKKKDSSKTTFRIQRVEVNQQGRLFWRITLWRLEWFPRRNTWRIIETRRSCKPGGQGWERVIHADLGNIDEATACEVAIPTALLLGLR